MISFLQNKILRHPYISLLLCSFYFFFLLIFSQINLGIGDLHIYLEVVQNLHSGGVLYQSAIDTKNMGFFFFFYYIIYLPYALLFSTMEYFFHWMGIFLSLWYFLTSVLIYRILLPLYNNALALLSACFYFVVLTACSPWSYFINQPQIAVFFHLLLIFVIMQQKETRYFLYGWILGICFSLASPYAFLVLTVPILALISYTQDKKFIAVVQKGGVAFLGFLIALLPFVWYLLYTDSISDWWYWNFTFPTTLYNSDLNFFSSLKQILYFLFGKSIAIKITNIPALITPIILYTLCLAWIVNFIQKKPTLSLQEKTLLGISALSLIPRLGLARPYASYNIYLVPLLILHIPFVWNILSSQRSLKKGYQHTLILCMSVALLYVPIHFYLGTKAYYADPIKQLTLSNPKKTPTVMLTQWAGYTYSTHWNHVYYNFYSHFDDSYQQNVYKYQPEMLFIRQDALENQFSEDRQFINYLDTQYTKIFQDHLTETSGIVHIYIQNNHIPTWNNLPILGELSNYE
ncbi:MAG: hypothetical protein ACRCR9_02300 [Chitinophagaceae bacterium]